MSKILSYNNKTTGEGWIQLNGQYSADEIEQITDSNDGLTPTPRTAIPSPFAQMDLVKNAFARLAEHNNLHGELMDERLVSNALDVAQLFFNFDELKNKLHIVVWNKENEIAALKNSSQHRLLGETIEMFLSQDRDAFNFDKMHNLFFIVSGNQVLGGTSPVSLFMATPNDSSIDAKIPVEQNVMLFEQIRPLHEREPQFVKYIYALFTAHPELKQWCGEVNSYLIRSLQYLDSGLRNEIVNQIGNPEAYDHESIGKAQNFITSAFKPIDDNVEVLGVQFYCVRQQDIYELIQQSDFKIEPTRSTSDERLPLVLRNRPEAAAFNQLRYVVGNWNFNTVISPVDWQPEPDKRILPATSHQYPWLTDDDFLQPTLIRLDYKLDDECFFNACSSQSASNAPTNDYLLPIKPLFFKYFNAEDLWAPVGGKPMFEMERHKMGNTESVQVKLRIPIQKQGCFITLMRTYTQSNDGSLTYDTKNDCGRIVNLSFALNIFPFVKCPALNQYNVQLIDRALGAYEHYDIALQFCKNGESNKVNDDKICVRQRSMKAEKRVGTYYYRVADDFDFMQVQLNDHSGKCIAQAMACPKWPNYIPGHETYTFAIDFGTTNTHMECMHEGSLPQPIALNSSARERMTATLYNGENLLYDALMKQEFIPKEIGNDYSFPLRTVLSECERLDANNIDEIVSLGDANIPFIYEKESIGYGNRIMANLKWSTEISTNKRVRAFLTQLALIMRTKVLIENGDLAKTKIVWFYPLSMKTGSVRKMADMWTRIVSTVFGINNGNQSIIQMPESVAPYYFYKCSSQFRGAASSVASIDIGGGTSDVVVFEPGADQPSIITSFRFAANVLFGDGFSEVPHGDTNPMTKKYVDYFKRLFDTDDDKYGELNGILSDIADKRKSEDINAFLFSVALNKQVKGNETFSYNLRLNEDSARKIIFIYFYSAIIYYVAKMMQHRNMLMPRSIMFSGTGSKVLDIVGSQYELDALTKYIFEKVYGETYGNDGFSVIMERNEPKQITCRGALMQVRTQTGVANIDELNHKINSYDNNIKYVYSLISKEDITYNEMNDTSVRKQIVDSVKVFNDFFISLCDDLHITDLFLVDFKSLQLFKQLVNKDLEHHLANGWNFMNKDLDEKNLDSPIEDAVFFYPIIGSIRDNLIENLKDN